MRPFLQLVLDSRTVDIILGICNSNCNAYIFLEPRDILQGGNDMIVKVYRRVRVHKVPRRIAERRRRQELHRIVDALDVRLYDEAKSHLKILLALNG